MKKESEVVFNSLHVLIHIMEKYTGKRYNIFTYNSTLYRANNQELCRLEFNPFSWESGP